MRKASASALSAAALIALVTAAGGFGSRLAAACCRSASCFLTDAAERLTASARPHSRAPLRAASYHARRSASETRTRGSSWITTGLLSEAEPAETVTV